MGLLSTVMAGAAQGFSNATQQNNQADIAMINRQLDWSIKSLMDERVADRAKTDEAARYTRGKTDESEKYTRDRSDKKTDISDAATAAGIVAKQTQTDRLELQAAGKDPSDWKIKELQLKALMEDAKVPPLVKTEYASLDKSISQIDAAMNKAKAEGTGDTNGLVELSKKRNEYTDRQRELLASVAGYKKAVPDIDRLFEDKRKPGGKSDATGEF